MTVVGAVLPHRHLAVVSIQLDGTIFFRALRLLLCFGPHQRRGGHKSYLTVILNILYPIYNFVLVTLPNMTATEWYHVER